VVPGNGEVSFEKMENLLSFPRKNFLLASCSFAPVYFNLRSHVLQSIFICKQNSLAENTRCKPALAISNFKGKIAVRNLPNVMRKRFEEIVC
jgi:hypothetical protein